jgi:hypothetical protein
LVVEVFDGQAQQNMKLLALTLHLDQLAQQAPH